MGGRLAPRRQIWLLPEGGTGVVKTDTGIHWTKKRIRPCVPASSVCPPHSPPSCAWLSAWRLTQTTRSQLLSVEWIDLADSERLQNSGGDRGPGLPRAGCLLPLKDTTPLQAGDITSSFLRVSGIFPASSLPAPGDNSSSTSSPGFPLGLPTPLQIAPLSNSPGITLL